MNESNSDIAVEHHIRCRRGDTFSRVFQYYQEDGETPLDITGSEFKMDVVDLTRKKKIILEFAPDNGLEMTDTNEITLSKDKDEMQLQAGKYSYDLQKTTEDVVITIMQGDFIITDDRTQ